MSAADQSEGLAAATIEVAKVPALIAKWLEVGYPDKAPTPADAWHSALLVRLLSGRDPLPEPPPLAFSYPWYQLIEQGWDEGYMDIGVYPEGVPVYQDEQPSIMICQARWLIEEKVSATEWIVAWEPTGLRARLEITDDVGGAGKHGRLTVLVSTAA